MSYWPSSARYYDHRSDARAACTTPATSPLAARVSSNATIIEQAPHHLEE
jgi:hypothetical protein